MTESTHLTQNQENHKLDEKRQLTANTEMNQILELSDNDFKAAIIKKTLLEAITNFHGTTKQ